MGIVSIFYSTRCNNMAESEGFEPSIGDKPYTPLAGARLQPLGQLSVKKILYAKFLKFKYPVFKNRSCI